MDLFKNIKKSDLRTSVRDDPYYGQSSYVYFIYSTSNHFKIGKSDNPHKRLKQLKATQGPYEYFLVHAIETDDAFEFEKELHDRFSDCRVNGEWFNSLPENDLEFLFSTRTYQLY